MLTRRCCRHIDANAGIGASEAVGREETVSAGQAVIADVDRLPVPEQLPYVDAHAHGIEHYLMRLYPSSRTPR
jgi:hypothetical protein